KDRSFELLQLAARLEPELIHQPAPGSAIALERVGLATGPVHGEHQLGDEALTQRMLVNERLQLPHQPCVLAERKLGVDPFLQRDQPRLLQSRYLWLRERRVREIRERGVAPGPQSIPQPRGRS